MSYLLASQTSYNNEINSESFYKMRTTSLGNVCLKKCKWDGRLSKLRLKQRFKKPDKINAFSLLLNDLRIRKVHNGHVLKTATEMLI